MNDAKPDVEEARVDVLIGIDDTDNLDSPGTGALLAEIATLLEGEGRGRSSFITRHQLFVHPDIPYTSHNAAMCLAARIAAESHVSLVAEIAEFLARRSAAGSDPGLCVAAPAELEDSAELIAYGQEAKRSVLTKQSAYDLARRQRIHLSEHGGSGQGVIGALAGVGLRLSGIDGRMRGSLRLPDGVAQISVKAFRDMRDVEAVNSLSEHRPNDEDMVEIGEKVKTVMLAGHSTLLLRPAPAGGTARWRTCSKQELKDY